MKHKITATVGIVVLLLMVAIMALPVTARPPLGVTNFDSIHLSDTGGTATPVLRVDSLGTGKIVEFLDAGTPVFSINDGGGVGDAQYNNLVVSAPTAIGTATPAALIDNLGVSNLLEIRDAATPVLYVANGGNVTQSGGQTQNNWVAIAVPTAVLTTTPAVQINSLGISTNILDVQDGGTSELTVLNGGGVEIAAPTAVGTAQPAFQVDSSGGLSNLLEIRDSATPVFQVHDGGAVTGKVLRYSTAGEQIVCGTDTITGTANVSHGLTTPTYATCALGADPTGDAQTCSTTITGSTATVKVWQSNATPTANSAGISVDWCVIGTP